MNLLPIESKEKKPALVLFLMFFCIVSASITGSSARDTFFLTKFDNSYLPLMFLAISIVMVFSIALYNRLSAGKDIISTICYSSSLFVFALFVIQFSISGIMIPVLYIAIDIITSISILQFWILSGEIFNPRQAKRIFSLIASGGSIAGMLIGYTISPFVEIFGATVLLYPTMIFITLSALLSRLLKKYKAKKESHNLKRTSKNISEKPLFNKYLKSILLMVCIAAVCSKIIEYQFKITAAETYKDPNELASFFGIYYMATGAATLFVQFFITNIIFTRLGIIGGLLILPMSIATGSILYFMIGGISTVFLARFSDQVFKFSIDNTSKEILWIPVSKNIKKRAKSIIDSSIKSIFEGLIGVTIFLLVYFKVLNYQNIHWLSIVILVLSIFWIFNSFIINKGYLKTLIKAIDRRELNLEQITYNVNDPFFVETIKKNLMDKDDFKKLFALEIIKDLRLLPWGKILNKILISSTKDIQKEIFKMKYISHIISDDNIDFLLNQHNTATALCISKFDNNQINLYQDQLLKLLKSENVEIQAASAVKLFSTGYHLKEVAEIIDNFILVIEPIKTIKALGYLKESKKILLTKNIINLLSHESIDIRKEALLCTFDYDNNDLVNLIIKNLDSAKTYSRAKEALSSFDKSHVLDTMLNTLNDKHVSLNLKHGIIKSLSDYPDKKTIESLKEYLNSPNLNTVHYASDSISKIFKTTTFKKYQKIEIFNKHIEFLCRKNYENSIFFSLIEKKKNNVLLIDHLNNENTSLLKSILKLVMLHIPNSTIEQYAKFIIERDLINLPFVIELIESSSSQNINKLILPIIDAKSDKIDAGKSLNPKLRFELDEYLTMWAESGHTWKSAIAIEFMLKEKNTKIMKDINLDKIDNSIYLDKVPNNIESKKNDLKISKSLIDGSDYMFTILEKTIILKGVELFTNLPGKLLSSIAQISQVIHYKESNYIFKEGDFGDSMFIIVSGEVNINHHGKGLATLSKGECLGEMAILDNEPRSADARAKNELILLQIGQNAFYEIMSGNAEIMKQIIKMLTSRLRDMNTKLK